MDAAGNLYGLTSHGGGGTGCDDSGGNGCGVVFELTPNSDGTWTEGVLHRFAGGKAGGYPDHGSLVFDTAGNLFGVTHWQGRCQYCGTVFELTPNSNGGWTEKVILHFNSRNGSWPEGTLIFDTAGSLYGTSARGGPHGQGNVFKLTLGSDGKWKQQIIHDFTGHKDGGAPNDGVAFDTSGNLYGTATIGGGGPCHYYGSGCGTAFELIPNGGKWTDRMLHRFWAGKGGASPNGTLVFDAAGNIYGATSDNASGANGLVYEITP